MSEVLVSIEDGIMQVTINRPEVRNAVNAAVARGIADAMDELDSNRDCRVAILSGAGGTFCAGMDLKAFVKGERPVVKGRGFAGITEKPPRKPLIAALEGYVLAGGLELMMACDLAIAAESALFGIPEVKRGLIAAGGGVVKLPRLVPQRIALELALTGDNITAKRAYEVGLVNRVVADDAVMDATLEMARKIQANAPLAVLASKQSIIESADWPLDELFVRQRPIQKEALKSPDVMEGARAFAEKRKPEWQG